MSIKDTPKIREMSERLTINITPASFRTLLDLYRQTNFPGRRQSTINQVTKAVTRWIEWMIERRHRNVSFLSLSEYVTWLWETYNGTAPAMMWQHVRRFLHWLEMTKHIDFSPHHVVKTPITKSTTIKPIITLDEYRAIRAACSGTWVEWLIILGWNTGMALIDCVYLQWGSVDFQNSMIRMRRRKTGTPADIPFDPSGELGRALRERRAMLDRDPDPEDYVSPEARSSLFDAGHNGDTVKIGGAVRAAFDKAGVSREKSFHSFRYSFVSRLANSGMGHVLASKVSGHKTLDVFTRYVIPDTKSLARGVMNAWESSGDNREVDVSPDIGKVKLSDNMMRPNTIYIVKKGKGVVDPAGNPIDLVLTPPQVEGITAICTPCDWFGKPTGQPRLLVARPCLKHYKTLTS